MSVSMQVGKSSWKIGLRYIIDFARGSISGTDIYPFPSHSRPSGDASVYLAQRETQVAGKNNYEKGRKGDGTRIQCERKPYDQ
jgi:hypothetical protein